jgi:hypothetical protein
MQQVMAHQQDLPWLEIFALLGGLEVNQGRKGQDHVPPFVHDRAVAVRAANFAWQLVLDGLLGRVVPL